ncbi:MAG: 2-C-methyl-D-erythritol 2,4-cyclodiphosphate synthase [Syntrophales bacterium]|nr:2-C-methyl-D-erythritol 2,4-cyclodiphosphate synthase [Syntrophales bacterium]
MIRVGIGYDSHRWQIGRKLILAGIEIPSNSGLLGHSDADVICHAIGDAILGSISEGDIGSHFPPNDPRWKDAPSTVILSKICDIARKKGYRINNMDVTVILEHPHLQKYIPEMIDSLSKIVMIDKNRISIKAKTNEGMGFIGRGEGVAAMAVVTVKCEND